VTLLGWTGPADADTLADLLVRHPAHVPFLARRIWARYGSDDPIPPATAQRMAAAGRDVTAMLTALCTDPALPDSAGHLVKQPVEWMAGALRQLGADPGRLTAAQRRTVLGGLRSLGQVPFRPPSVGGWPAGPAWLTTGSAQARLRLGQALAALAPAAVDELAGSARADRIDTLTRLLVVDGWTGRTRAVLDCAAGEPRRLLALGLASPEYAVQ
jgi:uncharacterized protein (DUF1800 family)